ncbi:MAG: hypothetical protein VX877_01060, partial [Planctomycetota bacterium]|nr:hypothetical protein [Planctomycetota bacterium]
MMDTPVPGQPVSETPPEEGDGVAAEDLEETYVPDEADTGDLAEMPPASQDSSAKKPSPKESSPDADEPTRKSKASELGDFKLLK